MVLFTISLFTSSINTIVFTSWIEQEPLPKLSPKRVLILDNGAFHKGIAMQKILIEAGHTLLYLPPHSGTKHLSGFKIVIFFVDDNLMIVKF